jgi:16S rRNA (guanine966-N2)-methyltransferase
MRGPAPDADRVRETLFNWLAPYVAGAKVLDPFAGSGALSGSLVRGAAMGQALDASHVAVSSLKEHLGTLRCTNGQVQTADALRYLETQVATPFDLVFLDPPFNQNLLPAVCTLLEERQWLAPDRGSTPKARPRHRRWACRATGACTASRNPGVYYALWQRMAVN